MTNQEKQQLENVTNTLGGLRSAMTEDIKLDIISLKCDVEWIVQIALEKIAEVGDELARRRVMTMIGEMNRLADFAGCTHVTIYPMNDELRHGNPLPLASGSH